MWFLMNNCLTLHTYPQGNAQELSTFLSAAVWQTPHPTSRALSDVKYSSAVDDKSIGNLHHDELGRARERATSASRVRYSTKTKAYRHADRRTVSLYAVGHCSEANVAEGNLQQGACLELLHPG